MLCPDPDRRHAGRVPLVGDRKVVLGCARADERSGDVQYLRKLLDGAAQDLLRIEARSGTLGDPIGERFALRARLGLFDGERAVYGARDVLAHDHRELDLVRDEIAGPFADEEERSDETLARDEGQRRERLRGPQSRQLLHDLLPHIPVRLVVDQEK